MDNYINNISDVSLNMLEYCYIAETVDLPLTTVKVNIPKLMPLTSSSKPTITSSIFINDTDCKVSISKNLKTTDYLTIPVFNVDFTRVATNVKNSEGDIIRSYLPKGKKMIVCFMENNVNDPYLTNYI